MIPSAMPWQYQEALLKQPRVKSTIVRTVKLSQGVFFYNFLLRVSNNLAMITGMWHASSKMMQVIGRLCDTILRPRER